MNPAASPSCLNLRTASMTLAVFMAGVLAASVTASLTLRWTTIVAAATGLACALACIVWSHRQERLSRLAHASPFDDDAHNTAPVQTFDEARLTAIIRSSREAIVTIDAMQRIVLMNPMAEELLGCEAAKVLGGPLSRFIPERFRIAHAKHVEHFGATSGSDRRMGSQRVLYALRADGREFPIEASISQSQYDNEKLYTVMLRDITERVRAEEALKQSREDLRELSANLQRVREEEKAHIARELHDDLGQSLTALKMDLSVIGHALEREGIDNAYVHERLHAMTRVIDAMVASVRHIAANQRPAMLDDLGLVAAIDWLADDFSQRYGIRVARRLEVGAAAFSHGAATAIFRIVQEALTNVAKHARASLVTLAMRVDGEHCTLDIVDDGRGLPAAGHPRDPRTGRNFGLLGIRERVHMLGGTLSTGEPGRGFNLSITFPLDALQSEETQP
ncbi:PAS domain-containing sensor histidine kinase [Paraburkholderia sp. XV]|jgi:PAS domain S-box-containing protein|uniref:PAS domain-containing sensor histidine kinase n=1 Tax=Paraburkholderia sp. XV TaxID=2831520 RepID=UPI0006D48031|nr:PAS domain-containing sensor histidine kinase [Paraburkholderia sp. XV]